MQVPDKLKCDGHSVNVWSVDYFVNGGFNTDSFYSRYRSNTLFVVNTSQ